MSDAVDFLRADKQKILLQIDIKIFWLVYSSIPKVAKIAILQCLKNISKKKVRAEVDFLDADKQQSFQQVDFNFWASKFPDMSKQPNMSKEPKKGRSLNFCDILTKSITTAFVFYCDAKHPNTLQGSSHGHCYFFLGGCGQNWVWPFRSWNSKICCISRLNWWNELIFFAFWYEFRVGMVKNGWELLDHMKL